MPSATFQIWRGNAKSGKLQDYPVEFQEGMVVLDFNQAYNPPCAFTEYATCELPGLANRLNISVAAGEKVWGTGNTVSYDYWKRNT